MNPDGNGLPQDERRHLERFTLQAPTTIEVRQDDGRRDTIRLLTKDISSQGVFLETAEPLTEGMSVKLEVRLSLETLRRLVGEEQGEAKVVVRGTVIRADERGMAIRFDGKYRIQAMNGLR